MHRQFLLLLLLSGLLLLPLGAQAGLSRPAFTDIAKARLEVVSFFLASCFLLAFIYQRLWNPSPRCESMLQIATGNTAG